MKTKFEDLKSIKDFPLTRWEKFLLFFKKEQYHLVEDATHETLIVYKEIHGKSLIVEKINLPLPDIDCDFSISTKNPKTGKYETKCF